MTRRTLAGSKNSLQQCFFPRHEKCPYLTLYGIRAICDVPKGAKTPPITLLGWRQHLRQGCHSILCEKSLAAIPTCGRCNRTPTQQEVKRVPEESCKHRLVFWISRELISQSLHEVAPQNVSLSIQKNATRSAHSPSHGAQIRFFVRQHDALKDNFDICRF